MSLILNIDTSSEKASIAIAREGETLYLSTNNEQRDHASWIHQAVRDVLRSAKEKIINLKAVGVTSGPGSYTGLRVGLSTAKGLCYALGIPLITINSLEAMCYATMNKEADLFCPLIDARRMEVFTALYDNKIHVVMHPVAMVIDEQVFSQQLKANRILFFGSGRTKLQGVLTHPNALFSDVSFDASHLSSIINKNYNLTNFANLTYSEPSYIKDVYVSTKNKLD